MMELEPLDWTKAYTANTRRDLEAFIALLAKHVIALQERVAALEAAAKQEKL